MVLSSRETHSVGTAVCAAIVSVLAWGTLGAELLIMDKKGRITKTNHGFFQDKPPVPRYANINLKSPVDYSTGKIYARAEVKLMPTAKDFKLQMQICQYKADGTGPYYGIENTGGRGLMNGTTGETSTVTTWSWGITGMWKAGGVPIDWSRERTSHAAVVWTVNNKNLSDYDIPGNPLWGGVNPDDFYPMSVRFTCVIVTPGATFSGWDTYISTTVGVNETESSMLSVSRNLIPPNGDIFNVVDLKGRVAGGTTPAAHGLDPTSSSLHNGISTGVPGLSGGLYILRWRDEYVAVGRVPVLLGVK